LQSRIEERTVRHTSGGSDKDNQTHSEQKNKFAQNPYILRCILFSLQHNDQFFDGDLAVTINVGVLDSFREFGRNTPDGKQLPHREGVFPPATHNAFYNIVAIYLIFLDI
jgi:hypothetical protein